MTFVDFEVGNYAFVYIHGLPRSTPFNEKCIKVEIKMNNGEKIRTMSDNGVIYDFSPELNYLTKDPVTKGVYYKLLLNESAVGEYLTVWDMFSEMKDWFNMKYVEFEGKYGYETIKRLFLNIFPDKLEPIPWVAHNVGKPNERYNASARDFAYLITFVIELCDNGWHLTVSGAGNKETIHRREFEFCSIEHTLEDAMAQAEQYYKMIYNMVKEDLNNGQNPF